MAAEDTGRITVSRDALKAELVGLELRLVERLATKDEVRDVDDRLNKVEETLARVKGALALVAIAMTALSAYAATHF